MEIGLLLLRLALGGLLFGHGAQKMFGWFGGLGLDRTGGVFSSWGLRPGRTMAFFAAASEITAAALLVLGLLSPLAAAMTCGTLIVAGSVNASKGLWAQTGGFELPLLYAVVGAALGFTGPGEWSLDHAFGLTELSGAAWGSAAVGAAALAAAGVITRASLLRRRSVPA
ncbi:DoxX family membrane protein [Streptomyces sp. NPDC049906]|uniref:DoxX family membrane protein n=1 Tax=Streptomyces sp. NPDC049906 TaxID=3155656 RepID=UPI003424DE01